MLRKGFVIAGVPVFWQPIAVSIVFVAAVWFDQARRKVRDRKRHNVEKLVLIPGVNSKC